MLKQRMICLYVWWALSKNILIRYTIINTDGAGLIPALLFLNCWLSYVLHWKIFVAFSVFVR